MAGYVIALGAMLAVSYANELVWPSAGLRSGLDSTLAQRLGRNFFISISTMQVLLGILVAPAITAGALTVEREQRSFELLAISLVRPWSIVFGKLVSALSFIVLLAVASIPLVSVCFLLGGVDTHEFAAVYSFII
jgi:ABC-type transport system involved in multi-copper enzyme maturation permease subunit